MTDEMIHVFSKQYLSKKQPLTCCIPGPVRQNVERGRRRNLSTTETDSDKFIHNLFFIIFLG